MTDFTTLSLTDLTKGYAKKDFTCREVVTSYLARMEATKALNAYVLETPDIALAAADRSDARLQKQEALKLDGIPVAVKDLFCTRDIPTTACSKILEGYKPKYESTVTQKLWDAGAVMLGKTNMDEFAMGSANMTSAFGPVLSPVTLPGDTRRFVPGGSSGGSAAAVAARSALMATGSDTGGSIRQPAAFCGIVGMKPTYGLCSRYGMVAFASSLDQAGPLTRTVGDAALMLQITAGHDPKDATSLNRPVPDFVGELETPLKGLRVGIPREYQVEGLGADIVALWEKGRAWLVEQGATCVEVSLPHTKYALPAYYVLAPAEASSNLARYDGVRYGLRVEGATLDEMYENTRAAGFGDEVTRRVLMGTYVLSAGFYDAYYRKAQRVRRVISDEFRGVFENVDVILAPTTPTPSFAFGEEPKDPISMYMNDVLTVPANIAGLPAISVPAGLSKEGLPLGLQIIGPAFGDSVVLRAGLAIERAANFVFPQGE
ncbi:MAG: Asp-tRNA(Asn)/Glu-tRNA(Gln) amidotransferase GatCAB subunit A [Candidatus Puniceispirillum sp.]|nr:Asp-tRNA(Asn)/Glu-tRNA(Gln) amidotransferase GatCAB subunit A [Candidatus Puniceispirillum sp.]